MSDPYAAIAKVDESIQARLTDVLELRGADQRQKEMLASYLSDLNLPEQSNAIEIGCGTGVVSRYLSTLPNVQNVTGLDPSPVFIEKAKLLSTDFPGISFQMGDARELAFEDESFDLVVFHTALCHVPSPEDALKEAYRILRPGGLLAIFDGDYTSASVAVNDCDPLQSVVEKMLGNFVENIWLVRQLPRVLVEHDFLMKKFRSHAYSAVSDPSYMLTLIDRGVELLVKAGTMGLEQAQNLRTEATRRVESGEFFGHITYISVIAQK